MNAMTTERTHISIGEFAAMLGVSKGFIRLEILRGNLRAIKRGRRVLIPRDEHKRYTNG